LAGFLYEERKNLREGIILTLKGALPFLAVTLPWVIITSLYYGRPAIRDPHYSEANFRSSSSIKYEGYDLDYAEKDFWIYPVSYTISHDPLGYANLLVKKFDRLWSKPSNDFSQSFIISLTASKFIHLLIVVTALFGIFYYLADSNAGHIYLFFIPLYYTFLHVIFHSLARYNLNPMPILMIVSAAILIKIYDHIQGALSGAQKNARLIAILLVVIGSVFILTIPSRLFIDLLSPSAGLFVYALLTIMILGGVLYYLAKNISTSFGLTRAVRALAPPGIILLVVLLVLGSAPESWAEWKYPVHSQNQAAGTRIYIPRDFRVADGESPAIRVDLLGKKGGKNKFLISVNGVRSAFMVGQKPVSYRFYGKATYTIYQRMLGIEREEIRHWSYLALAPEVFNAMIARDGYIDIGISPADSGATGSDVTLFGNYSLTAPDSTRIPDLARSSAERLIDKGDPRVWINYPLSSDSAISYYITDMKSNQVSREDLSPSFGKQTGRYRIYIEIERLDRSVVYF